LKLRTARLQEFAVETAVALGTNCTDSSYDGNPLIIATATATTTSAVKAATSAAAAIKSTKAAKAA
jgi:hypothetical protein